jgi:hypothetical protein
VTVGTALAAGTILLGAPTAHSQPTPQDSVRPIAFYPPVPIRPIVRQAFAFFPPDPVEPPAPIETDD